MKNGDSASPTVPLILPTVNTVTVRLTRALETISKQRGVADDGTRGGHKPIEAGPGNWPASCRSAPVSPGTWRASPRCVPPPTVGRGRISLPIGPASPPQCAGYVHSIGRRQLSRGLWDCHTLCPSTGFERLTGAPLLCSPRSVSRVSYHGRWLQPPLRSGVRLLRRPGCSSCSRLCPGRWGFVQWRPPKTRFAYRAIRRLPFPVHAAQLLAFFYQDSPDGL